MSYRGALARASAPLRRNALELIARPHSAMNVGHDTTDPAQMEKAFAAAEAGDFKLFFSFDMVYFGKAGGTDWILNDYLGKYGKHHAHYLYNNKVFVSTFSGEISGRWLNDAGSFDAANQAWTALFKQSGLDIFYAPNWNDDSLVSQNVWGGAAFHWFGWYAPLTFRSSRGKWLMAPHPGPPKETKRI